MEERRFTGDCPKLAHRFESDRCRSRHQRDLETLFQPLTRVACPNPRMQVTQSGTVPLRATTQSDAIDGDAVDATLAAAGDSHAFERLYRRHLGRIHSLVRRMIGDDAEDVTQEIFIRTWQARHVSRRFGIRHLAAPPCSEPDPDPARGAGDQTAASRRRSGIARSAAGTEPAGRVHARCRNRDPAAS